MARPFRHQPPDLAEDLVLRVSVQSVLAGRFDRRVTVVVAGAGFGKTTALVQAFGENHLRPLGVDLWLGCEPADRDPTDLTRGLAVALGLEEACPPEEVVELAAESLAARSPQAVALVLDDVHFLYGSPSSLLIGELIDRLPSNAHLVLCGRSLPDVALTRLELLGECVVIDEAALALSASQASNLLGTDAQDNVSRYGGWPALLRLAGSGRAERFVREEVLDMLDADQLDVLRVLVALGEADTEMMQSMSAVAADSVLATAPLVHRRGEVWGAHDLWAELLGGDRSLDEVRRKAADIALARGDAEWAVEVMLRCELPDTGGDANDVTLDRCLRAALVSANRLAPHTLRRWHRHLHSLGDVDVVTPVPGRPAHSMLVGLINRLDNPGSDACHRWLRAAASEFSDRGDDDAAVAALAALLFAYHVRRDIDGLLWSFERLGEFAERSVRSAAPFPLLGQALVATSRGEPSDVVAVTEPLLQLALPVEVRCVALWLHANALGNLGCDAVEHAEGCYRLGLPLPGIAMIYSGARWRSGHIREMRSAPIQPLEGERDRFLMSTWECCLAATTGELAEAQRHLDVIEASSANESQWQTAGSVDVPRATLMASEGRLEEATAVMREFVAANPPHGQAVFYRLFAIGLVYVLLPEERPWFHERARRDDFGPLYRRDLAIVMAYVAAVEDSDLGAVALLSMPDGAEGLIPTLGVRNGATLLAAGVASGRGDLDAIISDFVDLLGEHARRRWRELAEESHDDIARGARKIIESIPVPPAEVASVRLLGGTELTVGSRPVDHADWRRERVRALLTFLVLHPDTTRERVMAALWPDATAESARRSLRSTLNMLLSVLEPDRIGGDASYFVRTSGQRLRLVLDADGGGGPAAHGLDVDLRRFEAWVDEAEELEASGLSSMAIESYQRAVAEYSGDLLTDGYDDWVVFARDRLRGRFLGAAVRLGELFLATGRPREALSVAGRAVEIEPWSEPAHRVLVAAHMDLGDVATARRALETCEGVLSEIGGPSEEATHQLRRRLARR